MTQPSGTGRTSRWRRPAINRWDAIWRIGILYWGLPTFVVVAALDIGWDHGWRGLFAGDLWLRELRGLGAWLIGGVLFGLIRWEQEKPKNQPPKS